MTHLIWAAFSKDLRSLGQLSKGIGEDGSGTFHWPEFSRSQQMSQHADLRAQAHNHGCDCRHTRLSAPQASFSPKGLG